MHMLVKMIGRAVRGGHVAFIEHALRVPENFDAFTRGMDRQRGDLMTVLVDFIVETYIAAESTAGAEYVIDTVFSDNKHLSAKIISRTMDDIVVELGELHEKYERQSDGAEKYERVARNVYQTLLHLSSHRLFASDQIGESFVFHSAMTRKVYIFEASLRIAPHVIASDAECIVEHVCEHADGDRLWLELLLRYQQFSPSTLRYLMLVVSYFWEWYDIAETILHRVEASSVRSQQDLEVLVNTIVGALCDDGEANGIRRFAQHEFKRCSNVTAASLSWSSAIGDFIGSISRGLENPKMLDDEKMQTDVSVLAALMESTNCESQYATIVDSLFKKHQYAIHTQWIVAAFKSVPSFIDFTAKDADMTKLMLHYAMTNLDEQFIEIIVQKHENIGGKNFVYCASECLRGHNPNAVAAVIRAVLAHRRADHPIVYFDVLKKAAGDGFCDLLRCALEGLAVQCDLSAAGPHQAPTPAERKAKIYVWECLNIACSNNRLDVISTILDEYSDFVTFDAKELASLVDRAIRAGRYEAVDTLLGKYRANANEICESALEHARKMGFSAILDLVRSRRAVRLTPSVTERGSDDDDDNDVFMDE